MQGTALHSRVAPDCPPASPWSSLRPASLRCPATLACPLADRCEVLGGSWLRLVRWFDVVPGIHVCAAAPAQLLQWQLHPPCCHEEPVQACVCIQQCLVLLSEHRGATR